MTNPFGQNPHQQYDNDGLPVAPHNPTWATPQASQVHAQPQFAQPQYGMPQPMYGMPYPQGPAKSWIVAVLLAFFLGTLGVHNFYLGYTGRGVAQLVLSIVGWVTAILIIGLLFIAIVGVWAFIDLIMLLMRSGSMATDSNGVPLA